MTNSHKTLRIKTSPLKDFKRQVYLPRKMGLTYSKTNTKAFKVSTLDS